MLTLLVLLAVVAILFGAAVVATQDNQVLADAPPDDPDLELPTGRVVAEDLRAVRFSMVVRGYRMDQVDAVLARLSEELAVRDERIADLERVLAEMVEPAVQELEGAELQDEAPEPASPPSLTEEGAPEPASPPSLTPTLAQGARAGEAPAETPAPSHAAGALDAPAETPAPSPDPGAGAEELSPAAAFTLPSEVTSFRMPLVEQELEATPETDLEPEPVVEPADAPLPELDEEPETEAEIVDEPPARLPEPEAEVVAEPFVAEPFGAETLLEAELEDEPTADPSAGAAEVVEVSEGIAAAVADVFRESVVVDRQEQQTPAAGVEEAEPEVVDAEAVVVGDVPGVPEGFDAAEEFAFPEVLGAEADEAGLPESIRDDEERQDERRPGPPEPA